jgi:hypothetical protein
MGKKTQEQTKSSLSSRKLRPDTKEQNRDAHGITSSHCYDHVQYRNKTENAASTPKSLQMRNRKSTRLCSSYTEKKGWHKFCIEVQLYTVASDTYFAPACAKIRTKTWPKTVAIISRGGKETQNRACLHQNHSKCETENSTRFCSTYTEEKGWQKGCNQVQFYTRTIDQFSIS